MRKTTTVLVGLIATMFLGCASAPQTRPDQRALEARADATVQTFVARNADFGTMLDDAAGYAVFPQVAEGGFIVGGAQSVGVVYERGRPVGYVELREGSLGAQIGGQTYSQIVVFQTEAALDRLRAGNFDLGAGASVTAIQSGLVAQTRFENGVAIFVDDEAGLMAGATVSGQNLSFIAK